MCLGVTAGAYVLTLFAVSAPMSCLTSLVVDVQVLGFLHLYADKEFLYFLIDEISGKGNRADASFPSMQRPIVERMVV
jgi:hypothetical protein